MARLSEAEAWNRIEAIWEFGILKDELDRTYVVSSRGIRAYGICITIRDLHDDGLITYETYNTMINKIHKIPYITNSLYCWPLNETGKWQRINFCSQQFYALVLNKPFLAEPPSCANFVEIPNAQSLLTLSGQPNTDGASLTQADFGSIPATYVTLSTVILSSVTQ